MTRQPWRRQESFARLARLGGLRSPSQRSLRTPKQRTDLDGVDLVTNIDEQNPPELADELSPPYFDSSEPPLNPFDKAELEAPAKSRKLSGSTNKGRPDNTAALSASAKKAPAPKKPPPSTYTPPASLKPPPPRDFVLPEVTSVDIGLSDHNTVPSYTSTWSDNDSDYSDATPVPIAPEALRTERNMHHTDGYRQDGMMYQVPHQTYLSGHREVVDHSYRQRRYDSTPVYTRHYQQLKQQQQHVDHCPPSWEEGLSAQHMEYNRRLQTPSWEYSSSQRMLPVPARHLPPPQQHHYYRKQPYQPKAWIEISPGVDVPLRGADETWECIRNDFYSPITCFSCSRELCCIQDADFVLCPTCRVISPMASNGDRMAYHPERQHIGGVGLGFTMDDLFRWQMELLTSRR